jgi:hypothetical protein
MKRYMAPIPLRAVMNTYGATRWRDTDGLMSILVGGQRYPVPADDLKDIENHIRTVAEGIPPPRSLTTIEGIPRPDKLTKHSIQEFPKNSPTKGPRR